MHRDVQQTYIVVGILRRWTVTWVDVPRCRRCRAGHGRERVAFYVLIPSAVLTLMSITSWLLMLWTLGWLLLWVGMRQHWAGWSWVAPQPRRYARKYPAVRKLAADGWRYRSRPL